ncbi:MAG: glycoside hydrolase family 31 protein [Armatimonadetes bacterium]|nr:glycoside hydrolase family 31 protein [Armatimonadota bacterium]
MMTTKLLMAGTLALYPALLLTSCRAQEPMPGQPPALVTRLQRPVPICPPPARNAPSVHVTANGLSVDVSAADARTFHVVVQTASDANAAQPSPFVAETAAWRGAKAGPGAQLQIPAGRLSVSADGTLRLTDSAGRVIFSEGVFHQAGDALEVSLRHGAGQRLYGSGNEGMNRAGPLVHTSGTSVVSNGFTRIPFVWSTGGWGILVANDMGGVSWTDENGVMHWKAPAHFIDLYLMVAPAPYGLLDAYAQLTGRAPIPPRWTLGYLQSRWGYTDAADVQDKWHQFRDRHIPVDAFIYDYDWFVNDWDFNPKTFPDPKANLAAMRALGLHFVGIRKPRVNGPHLDYAKQRGWILVGSDIRYDLPQVRDWWWSHHAPLIQDGVGGWWNDEAEQSFDEFFYMTKTEWDGGRRASPQRVWSINRAFAPGMQRFGAAVWSGDISSSWDALRNQPGTLLNWSLCGMPFVAQDIGGFNGTPTPELYARWIEEGVFVPVMRAHGTINSPRWPWAFGGDVLAATKKAIELRYRLIPYLYTLAEDASRNGAPPMRPLFFEFPQDTRTFDLEDEWLVGRGLLAAPVLSEGGARDVYLPEGRWYDFQTGKPIAGGQTLHLHVPLDVIPTYVHAGTILPLGPVMQYTGQTPEDPLEVRVYPGAAGQFTLYEDSGDTYDYQRGAFSRIPMQWDDRRHVLSVGARVGRFPGMLTVRRLRVVLPDGRSRDATYRGMPMRVQL